MTREQGQGLGRLDDESAVYRRGDSPRQVHWGLGALAKALGAALAAVLLFLLRPVLGSAAPWVVAGVVVVLLAGYVVWRRRRNRRLTGSSTTWPG